MNDTVCDIRLKPGAEVFRDSAGWGVRMGADARRAQDAAQGAVLRALGQKRCRLGELLAAAAGCLPAETPEYMASLTLAEFILNFKEYLES
jgi:hypothetical protein